MKQDELSRLINEAYELGVSEKRMEDLHSILSRELSKCSPANSNVSAIKGALSKLDRKIASAKDGSVTAWLLKPLFVLVCSSLITGAIGFGAGLYLQPLFIT